jgi:hypothetical protein
MWRYESSMTSDSHWMFQMSTAVVISFSPCIGVAELTFVHSFLTQQFIGTSCHLKTSFESVV